MKILIIEDEPKTRTFLAKGLSEYGFTIDTAPDGQEGLFQAINSSYDLIILDVMMPKIDGWGVIKKIRELSEIPILFLTACDEVNERVQGLELGADDYLVKPFAFSELLARVRTLLRRGLNRPIEVLKIENLEMDLLRQKVTREGQRIDLTAKEFTLLSLLMRRQGELLSRMLIAEQVWDSNFDSDTNIVDVTIKRLRRKVDDPFDKKLIHTVRGAGYVLEIR
ncbi:MAG: heavy metal response regulator transcription factor [Gammaproteobacteria bacterium]|nr:heavy metal response regulator transcription factor [Gammaproteobacteria bacterium]